jgi:hypothetical protein
MMTESHKISTNAMKWIYKHGCIACGSLATFSVSLPATHQQLQTSLWPQNLLAAQYKTGLCPTKHEGVVASEKVGYKLRGSNNKKISLGFGGGGGSDHGVMSMYILRAFKFFSVRQFPPILLHLTSTTYIKNRAVQNRVGRGVTVYERLNVWVSGWWETETGWETAWVRIWMDEIQSG